MQRCNISGCALYIPLNLQAGLEVLSIVAWAPEQLLIVQDALFAVCFCSNTLAWVGLAHRADL